MGVQAWLDEVSAHGVLVAALSSASFAPQGRVAAYWACHVIGRAVLGHARNAAALTAAGVVPCILLQWSSTRPTRRYTWLVPPPWATSRRLNWSAAASQLRAHWVSS